MLVRGKRVPVLGGVSFEHTRIDLTDVPEARVGDEVVLIGKQGDEQITSEEIADIRNTDLGDVFQSVRHQIPRIYFYEGRPYKIETTLEKTLL